MPLGPTGPDGLNRRYQTWMKRRQERDEREVPLRRHDRQERGRFQQSSPATPPSLPPGAIGVAREEISLPPGFWLVNAGGFAAAVSVGTQAGMRLDGATGPLAFSPAMPDGTSICHASLFSLSDGDVTVGVDFVVLGASAEEPVIDAGLGAFLLTADIGGLF